MISDNNTNTNPDDRLNEALTDYMQRLDRGEAVDREAFLAEYADVADELCAYFDDADLVERMAGPRAADTLDSPGTRTAGVPPLGKIRYFGDYELLEEIARGGMGVVYKARQVSLNRIVAVKLILAGQLAGEADVKRFHAEAEAAANLDHPGIVPIFEIGEHGGQHYFSMGYVEGTSLAAKLAEGPLPPGEAAALLKQMAEAVQYAHSEGVIHRDLKPANVLIDKQGKARVTDFGLAKRVESDSDLTRTGQILGTPSYMPPEQAVGKADEIRETADVYALGAVLYAMLTGRPPFQADNPVDTLLQVKEREPVTPRQLNPKVPIDLETICLKCLEKTANRRYGSAAALAAELDRVLDDRPILARRISRSQRAGRWCKRNPVVTALLAASLIGVIATTWQAVRATLAVRRAEDENERAERFSYRNLVALAAREIELGNVHSARQALVKCPEERRGWEWSYVRRLSYIAPAHRLGQFSHQVFDAGFSGDGKRFFTLEDYKVSWVFRDGKRTSIDRQPDNTVTLWDTDTRRQLARFEVRGRVASLDVDGRLLAVGEGSEVGVSTISVFDTETNEQLWGATCPGTTLQTGFGPKTTNVIVLSAASDPASYDQTRITLSAFDVTTGNLQFQHPISAHLARRFWFTDDPPQIAFVQRNEQNRIVLGAFTEEGRRLAGKEIPNLRIEGISHIAISRDGKHICLFEGLQGKPTTFGAEFHDLRTKGAVYIRKEDLPEGNPMEPTYDADGKRLAFFGAITDFSFARPEEFDLLHSPPKAGLLTALWDRDKRNPWRNACHVYDAASGRRLLQLRGFVSIPQIVRFSPDGRTLLAAGGADAYSDWDRTFGEVVLWNADRVETSRTLEVRGGLSQDDVQNQPLWQVVRLTSHKNWRVAISSDGQFIVADDDDPKEESRAWAVESGTLLSHEDVRHLPAVSAARDLLERELLEMEWASARSPNGYVAKSPDGHLYAVGREELAISDNRTSRVVYRFKAEGEFHRPRFSPDSQFVAVGRLVNPEDVGGTFVYSVVTGKLTYNLEDLVPGVLDNVFTSDGTRLATTSGNVIKLWDLDSGEEVFTLRGHEAAVTGLAFSPDDSFLASVDSTGTVRLWEVQ